MQGTKFGCTMKSENGSRKDATPVYTKSYGAIVLARVKEKADARMRVVCRGYATHEEERGKWNFCVCDRFSADGFRTRAARVIRRRELGLGRPKGKNRGRERERPGGSWALGKRCVCVCKCALCVRMAGTRGAFHAPPLLKPRYEVKSGKKGVRVHVLDTKTRCVDGKTRET